MERCPVCRAKVTDDPSCQRCGTDLSLLLGIETQVTALEQRAVALLQAGDLIEARWAAREALTLKRSPVALALLEFLEQEVVAEHSQMIKHLMH